MATKQSNIIITANGKQAEAVLKALDSRIKELTKDEAGLKTQMDAMRRAGKANTEEYKNLQKQLQATRREMKQVNDAVNSNVSNMEKVDKAVGQLAKTTTRQLRDALRAGKKELERMAASDKQLEPLKQKLRQIQEQINKNTGETKRFGQVHGSVWQTAVRNITAYVGVFGAFNFLKSKITEMIKLNDQLSDQMADIRKVSGLAMEDIRQLTMNLSKIDTRTTLEELNKIAYAGAKLGFGNEGIEGLEQFTRAANQVNVALKEDLGEEALTALSKITENMGLIKKMGVENAMLATGSAMFKLASTSTAAAGPIVEVTKRIVPMAQQAGLATDEILALASAADSLQLMPEVVGTALSKLIGALQTNHNLIEKSFELPAGTVESWMKQGRTMDLILTIFDKMKEKGNMSALGEDFKKLGGEGFRLISVLTAMANHVDTVRTHLETSRQAFREATAVTEEYNIQQETAAALIERANNMWRNAFVNPEASETVKSLAKSWYDFTKNMLSSEATMLNIKLAIEGIILALRVLVNLIPGIMAFGIVKGIQKVASAIGLTTVATNGLKGAWTKMSAAMKANIWALAIAGIAQLVSWIHEWTTATSEAEEMQKSANKALEEAHEKADQEISTLSRLKAQIDDTNLSQSERNALLSKIRTDYDIYLNYLGIELKTVDDLAKHYDALTKVMKQRFAYQEREEYKKSKMAGEGGTRMNRRLAGAEFYKAAKAQGIDIDLELFQNEVLREKRNGGIDANAIRKKYGVDEGKLSSLAYRFIQNIAAEQNEEDIINAAFESEIGDFDYDKWLRTQVKGDFTDKPDKEAAKAARAAAAAAAKEERAAIKKKREDLQQAKTEAGGIISLIQEYYKYQEEAIEQMVADGKMTREDANILIDYEQQQMNEGLMQARLYISNQQNEFEKWRKEKFGEGIDQVNFSDQATKAREEIKKKNVENIRSIILRLKGDADADSSSLLEEIRKNAAQNALEIQRSRAKTFEEIRKILEEYDSMGKLNAGFAEGLAKLGFTFKKESFFNQQANEAAAAKVAQSNGQNAFSFEETNELGATVVSARRTRPEEAMREQFLKSGITPFKVNIESDTELAQWLHGFVSQMSQDGNVSLTGWAKAFEPITEWMDKIWGIDTKRFNELQSQIKSLVDEQDTLEAETYAPDITPEREKEIANRLEAIAKERETANQEMQKFQNKIESIANKFEYYQDLTKDLLDPATTEEEKEAIIDELKDLQNEFGDRLGNIRNQVKSFYLYLMEYERSYYSERKKLYERDKRNQEERFRISGETDDYERAQKNLDLIAKLQSAMGGNLTFFQQNGLADSILNDPEIQRIKLRMEWRQKELEDAKERGLAQELINQRQTELLEEFSNLAQKVSSEVASRISKIKELTEPMATFAEEMGMKIGDALFNMESQSKNWHEIVKSMILSYSKMTINMVAENITKKIQMALFYRQMEAAEVQHQTTMLAIQQAFGAMRVTGEAAIGSQVMATKSAMDAAEVTEEVSMATILTSLGISKGAAKIIGSLGWWGIPLVAVISSLLIGLLTSALSTAGKKTSTPAADTANPIKTKLVSGMLTYDEGNVSSYVGTDGHVYNARRATLPQGTSLVTSPIATTVNGQPSLVAERGPEIVIGRRTTRHIMLNEPALLQHLANLDRHRTAARYRPYDDGNLSAYAATMLQPQQPTTQQSTTDEQIRQTLETLTTAVVALQNRLAYPIEAKINKYGTGGLIDEVKSGLKFDRRYNN